MYKLTQFVIKNQLFYAKKSFLGVFKFFLGVFEIEKGCVTLLWPKIAVLPGPTENWNCKLLSSGLSGERILGPILDSVCIFFNILSILMPILCFETIRKITQTVYCLNLNLIASSSKILYKTNHAWLNCLWVFWGCISEKRLLHKINILFTDTA